MTNYKRKRVLNGQVNDGATLAFQTFKCFGGLLAVHKNGYYVRRVTGQDQKAVMNQLKGITHVLESRVAVASGLQGEQ